MSVLLLFRTNIPEKWYFLIMGGTILTGHFLRRHSRALDIHEVELSLFFLKRKMTKTQAKNLVRDVTGC